MKAKPLFSFRWCLLMALMVLSASFFLVNPGKALAASSKHPVKRYDLAKVLAMPGVRVVKETKMVPLTVTPKSTGKNVKPSTTYKLYTYAGIAWVYINGNFFCGYGTASAVTIPWSWVASESGALYVWGTPIDTTFSANVAYTSANTGCWNIGSGSLWGMEVEGDATWLDGTNLSGSVSYYAWQP